MRVRRHTGVLIALVLACGLAACGDDDADESSSDEPAATTTIAPADAVDVTMNEYSFAVSGTLKPGGTIRLNNAGKEFHLMALGKLKPGKTMGDITTLLQQLAEEPPPEEGSTTTVAGAATTTTSGGATTTSVAAGETTTSVAEEEEDDPFLEIIDEIGMPGTFQGPGQRAEITVPGFGEGSYALICFIPTEGGGPPHFAQGMVGELTVAGDKAAEPTADATFRVEAGKAITGPSTLQAGRRVLKFEGIGAGADQLEPGIAKLNAGATVADINEAFEEFFSSETLPVNAASLIPGQLVASLFDFGDARSVYVGIDLTAGTYGVVGNDTDPDDVPLDPVEKTTFTVT
jgi:hypothetical protein